MEFIINNAFLVFVAELVKFCVSRDSGLPQGGYEVVFAGVAEVPYMRVIKIAKFGGGDPPVLVEEQTNAMRFLGQRTLDVRLSVLDNYASQLQAQINVLRIEQLKWENAELRNEITGYRRENMKLGDRLDKFYSAVCLRFDPQTGNWFLSCGEFEMQAGHGLPLPWNDLDRHASENQAPDVVFNVLPRLVALQPK